jgi:segregation and condensation protein B
MQSLNKQQTMQLIEAAIFASEQPLSIEDLKQNLFENVKISKSQIENHIKQLEKDYSDRGINLKRLATGYRFQVVEEIGPYLGQMWQEKPAKYSRALLETLALIAYKQPITRGEIEDVRGVSVSSNIMRTLLERGWIKSVGHKEVPGRPSLYGTTSGFLDYFSLKSLSELPELIEPESLEAIAKKLDSEFMGVADETQTKNQESD